MTLLGGFKQHQDPSNDEAVQQAANFAVSQIGNGVKLEKVLSAQKQVVAGTNYKLELQTSDGKYSADVFQGLGAGSHELKSHKKL